MAPRIRSAHVLACCLAVVLLSLNQMMEGTRSPVTLEDLVRELDVDGDLQLAPYEGAEGLLRLLESADVNRDGGVDAEELRQALERARRDRELETGLMFSELDENLNGLLSIQDEIPPDFAAIARGVDANGDGELTLSEFAEITMDASAMAAEEAAAIVDELDRDEDGALSFAELRADERDEMLDFADANKDRRLTVEELEAAIRNESRQASFTVDGDRCIMSGVIGPSTPSRVLELICEHPEVKVIEMRDVPGSMDDPANLHAARWIRKHALATHVPADGIIASGGVDFFLAGAERSVDPGARLGVHSWGGGGFGGNTLPRDHRAHRLYLDFYAEIGTPAEFYWYTLDAAEPEDIHWMTAEEIERFQVESTKRTTGPK